MFYLLSNCVWILAAQSVYSLEPTTGMSEVEFSKLICPIGISGGEDKPPEVIAVSAAAELLQYEKCETKGNKSTTL